jgi:hypothetical protein
MSVEFKERDESMREALTRTIDDIDGTSVTLRSLLAHIGEHGLLILCALLTVPFLLPVSIPGVSTVFGLAIILISIALLTNRTPWIPRQLMDRPIDAEKLVPILRKGTALVERIEKVIKPRLTWLTDGGMASRLNGFGILLGGVLLIFPLGLIPFSNTLPAFAILFLCLGVSQRDGAFVMAGYGLLVATIVYFGVLAYLAVAAGRGIASMFGGG